MMIIGAIGCNYCHDNKFSLESPNGTGCGLMLLIKSPAVFVINSEKIMVQPGSFVMFSPEMPHSYRAADGPYIDDWVYFTYKQEEIVRYNNMGIPINKVMSVSNVEELSHILRLIAIEHPSRDEFSDAIKQHYVEIFMMKLARLIKIGNSFKSASFIDRYNHLHVLRNYLYAYPERMISVTELANLANMSYSGFQHLYKKVFGVSVMSDILRSRFDRAAFLLTTTNLGIKDIAEKCGYINEFSFMKKFKEIYGKTPTEYRKSQ
ncbi:MAG: AraC family transcriptional regulator [Oscillospiraceae bacterium]|nr:AraC family transcriptional regulator [Oscillospiraceae bacterium]